MAMYKAKDAGRNTMRFFSAAMQLAVETHAALEADLRHAVPNGELRLYYQLQVDAEQRPFGAEALARWVHPTRGAVSPLQFIPIAEESSLILDIGGWVLDTACAQLAQMGRRRPAAPPDAGGQRQRAAIPPGRFRRDGGGGAGAPCVRAVAPETRTDRKRHRQRCRRRRRQDASAARDGGVAVDGRLRHRLFVAGLPEALPLDQIKIDQSFTRDITTDPNDAVMVKTIIDLARNFHLHVIAEGVETPEQLDFLQRHGCMAYQGYLFGKPMPIERFEALAQS